MDFIHAVLESIGTTTIIIILLVAVIKIFMTMTTEDRAPRTINLAFSEKVLKKLRNIECLSGNNRIKIIACALATYECLWQAKKRGASIWIRETNQSEKQLTLE